MHQGCEPGGLGSGGTCASSGGGEAATQEGASSSASRQYSEGWRGPGATHTVRAAMSLPTT